MSLNLIGYKGVAMIAVSGLDMAIWDGLAKAAGMPLAVLLGGTLGPVPAYNSNGLWLTDVDTLAQEAGELVAEGGFKGLKLRLGRERLADDLAAIREVRKGAGDDIKLMVDFNQGLTLGAALNRCHDLDDQGLYWFEEPVVYDNLSGYAELTREPETAVQLGENFYGPRDLFEAVRAGAGDYMMPDLMRIRGSERLAASRAHRGGGRYPGFNAFVSGGGSAFDARDRNGSLAGVAGLGRSHLKKAVCRQ